MFIWGLNVVAVKFLIDYFPPVAMQSSRIFLAGLCALIVLYFLKDLRKLTRTEWRYTICAAIFGQLAHHSLLAIGLMETTASNAALILGLIPLATSIFAIIFFRDVLTWLRTVGIIFGFTGVAIVVFNSGPVDTVSRGDVLIFISMLAQAFSFIVIKKVTSTLSSRQMTAIMLLIGSMFLLVTSFIFEPGGFQEFKNGSVIVWSVFLLSAIFATGLGHILYNAAINQIGAGQTAIFNNFVPFFALIGSFFFLGEPIFLSQTIGFLFIVLGVLFGTGYLEDILKKRHIRKRQRPNEKESGNNRSA